MTLHIYRGAAVKLETTYGIDAVPSPAIDGVLCPTIDIIEPLGQSTKERTLVRPFFGQFVELRGAQFGKVDLEVELAGFGTAGPAAPTPGLDALLQICGHSRTVTAGTSVVYAPVSTALKSATIYVWQNGSLYKYTGCFGNLSITMSEDAIPLYKFSLWGIYQPVTDAALPAFTLSQYVQPVLANAQNTPAISVQGYAAFVKSFTFNLNNSIQQVAPIGATRRLDFVDRKVTGNVDMEAVTVAAKDFWTPIGLSTLGGFSVTHGTAVGNRVAIASVGGLQVFNPKFSDDRGTTHLAMDLRFVPSAGNDEYTITVT